MLRKLRSSKLKGNRDSEKLFMSLKCDGRKGKGKKGKGRKRKGKGKRKKETGTYGEGRGGAFRPFSAAY